eukprot:TRINITY_DN4234_c0_g1_i12.p1 TRINITY_DN4234_c0_g1~~TRINITY_DN4234_c0_g1_i12.p1  ORF type:complete len:449 (-),score=76.98 TRINITY_DN4234_c0_g1_i12:53-1399(-)
MSSSVDVLIIGAGVSGLYAGQLLNEVDNLSVLIVEAGQIIGGRVRQNQGFVPWKIDLGGEFIHGENTFVKKLSDSKGWKTIPSFNPETEYAYLGRERKSFLFLNDKDVEYMMDFVEKSGIEPPKIDCTLLDHVVKNKVPFRVLGLIDTSYAKTWSTDIDKIGMREYIREMEKEFDLDNGEDNFRLEESYAQLIEYMSTNLKIKLNWQAKKVIYSKEEGKVHVVNQHGEQIAAKKVILTIPITVLQSADIEFVPPLPAEKVQAIQSLQMDSALKVILKFRAKFWGDNNRVFCCADCFIPQIWFDGPPERNLPKDKEVWICVGFIGGDLAANISTMAKETVVDTFLRQLDEMFTTPENVNPASKSYLDVLIYDWSKHPFIRGSYTHPSIGADFPHTKISEPVHDYLFFAGEGSATTHESATVNGAIQTGIRAANEVAQSLGFTLKHNPLH